jgi:hypothetical protein
MNMNPKHPEVTVYVDLCSPGGNANAIVSKVQRALRAARCADAEIEQYARDARAGSYTNLLRVTRETVTLIELPIV